MNNKLEFVDQSVKIIFESGAESIYYDTKEEALKAVKDCHEKNKISGKEYNKFVEDISASDLPSMIEGLASLAAMVIGAYITNLIEEAIEKGALLSVKNPTFQICNCGKKPTHGYFYDDDNEKLSMEISSKQEAYMFIDKLEESEIITEGDASSLRVLVDLEKNFLESPLLN